MPIYLEFEVKGQLVACIQTVTVETSAFMGDGASAAILSSH